MALLRKGRVCGDLSRCRAAARGSPAESHSCGRVWVELRPRPSDRPASLLRRQRLLGGLSHVPPPRPFSKMKAGGILLAPTKARWTLSQPRGDKAAVRGLVTQRPLLPRPGLWEVPVPPGHEALRLQPGPPPAPPAAPALPVGAHEPCGVSPVPSWLGTRLQCVDWAEASRLP